MFEQDCSTDERVGKKSSIMARPVRNRTKGSQPGLTGSPPIVFGSRRLSSEKASSTSTTANKHSERYGIVKEGKT